MDQANNPNKGLSTGKELKNLYQPSPAGLLSVNPVVKKPDERDLLMGGILDGDDDMGINRYSTKSAPPELYLQQKSQLQQEENSYLYTKEYRDYYKEQNNPRLQKPLTRPDIFEHADIQQLQQQLTGLTITDGNEENMINRGSHSSSSGNNNNNGQGNQQQQQLPVISKQLSTTTSPQQSQPQQIQVISRKQSEVANSGSSPQKDLVIQETKNKNTQPIEVIRAGSPQAAVVSMSNYAPLPMSYGPTQQLNNSTIIEGVVPVTTAPPGITQHAQQFSSSSNTNQADPANISSLQQSQSLQLQQQQQQQLVQQQQYYQQQQQQVMMQGYQMMYYPGQQQPQQQSPVIPGTIPSQVNSAMPPTAQQQPTGMAQQYYPVPMQMASYAYPPNMMYPMQQVVTQPQQMIYPQQTQPSQQPFQVDNPYGVMISNDTAMYGYQGGYQVVAEDDHRRNTNSMHHQYQSHRNYQSNKNNQNYIPAHGRDRDQYNNHNSNNANGQNNQNYQQNGYKNRKHNNNNGNVYAQNYNNNNSNNQFLQHGQNNTTATGTTTATATTYSTVNSANRTGIQQFNQFQDAPSSITQHHSNGNNYNTSIVPPAVPFAMIFEDLINACKDQNSSRTIQKHFENASLEEKNKLFEKILPEALNLMGDQFGNYVIQKLLEQGTAEHKEKLFGILKGNVESLSVQTYGCRVIQKVLEEIKDRKDLYQPLVKELNSQNTKILACIQDQNGNHVIQKCFETLPSQELMQIVGQVTGHIQELAFHPYGCRVIQRILEFCTVQQTLPIYAELMKNLIPLCECQYGNYIIQYIIEKGNKQQKDQILESVQRNFVELSINKFASNVTEKSVVFSDDKFKSGVLDVLLSSSSSSLDSNPLESGVVQLTKNAFGNYVVQRLYEKANNESKLRMCQFLLQNQETYSEIIANSFGKHVLSYIEKNRVDMPYAMNGQQSQIVQRESQQQQQQVYQQAGYVQNNNNGNNSNVNRYSNPNNNHHHNNQHGHHHRNPFLYSNQNNNSNNSNNHHYYHNNSNYDHPNNHANNHNHYRRSNNNNNNNSSQNNNNY